MASRLSEESLKAVYDTGHQGLAVQTDQALDLLSGPGVDLDRLLLADDPEAAVQAVPPQPLYQALMRKGPEDALDVLEHLSPDQVVRIFDYDCWSEDRLVPLKAIRWLQLFKEIGPEQLYKRFRGLDEEYQMTLLGPLVEIFDEEEFEDLSQPEQDALHRMPCGTIFYRLKSEDPRIEEFVSGLIEAALGSDINYTYALLAHAAYLPPNEQEAQMERFRRARIEEDGFVSFQESLAIFRPVRLAEERRKWEFALGREGVEALVSADSSDELFLLRVTQLAATRWDSATFEQVSRGFALLGNSLAAAAKVETDDLLGIKRLLHQGQSLASLGLEYLAKGDASAGVDILAKESTQTLFRVGLTLVLELADATLKEFARYALPEAETMRRALGLDRRGLLIHTLETELLDILGFERLEVLKGLFNRFPVQPVETTMAGDGERRVLFKPISSLAALRRLATAIDGIAGTLHLASLAQTKPTWNVSLDRQLLTGLARVMVGGTFSSEPLRAEDLKKLAAVPPEALQSLAADFFAGVEGTLRVALAPGGAGWAVSRAADIYVEDPVQPVMTEFASLVLRLTAALGSVEFGDEASLILALRSLVQMQDKPQEGM